MNLTERRLRHVLFATLLACVSHVSLGDTCGEVLEAGKACRITVEKMAGVTNFSWGYLQLFQTHLARKDSAGLIDLMGCTTNIPMVDCSDVEHGLMGAPPKPLKGVQTLEYVVNKEDWDAKGYQFRDLFRVAYEEFLKEDRTNSTFLAEVAYAQVDAPPEPACTDANSYVQPCYARAICTQYAGCSRSKSSCLQCPPAP